MTIHYIQCIAASAIYLLTLFLVIKQNKKLIGGEDNDKNDSSNVNSEQQAKN